jgi:flagellar hook-length control protein FliK
VSALAGAASGGATAALIGPTSGPLGGVTESDGSGGAPADESVPVGGEVPGAAEAAASPESGTSAANGSAAASGSTGAAAGTLPDAAKSAAAAAVISLPSAAAGGTGQLAGSSNAVRATPVVSGTGAAAAPGSVAATSAGTSRTAASPAPASAGTRASAPGGVNPAAFANALRSGEDDQDDSANGVGEAGNASGTAQGTQTIGQAQINLALAEGSDATGATASALQAANAAVAAPPAAVQAPAMPSAITAPVVGGPASAPASTSVPASTALLSASDSAGLASDGSHAHGGAGDAGVGLGGSGGDGAAALQQLSSAAASNSADSAPAATLSVHAPVDSTDFPQGVADRVSFAVDNNWSSAKLQVNPPQLGPIDLQISVQGDHAQVMMSTHSAVTREALESSLPKLKEMLNSQGFTQVSVDISQRSFQDRSAFNQQPYTWAKSASGTPSTPAAAPVSAPSGTAVRNSLGGLDAYA